MLSYQQRVVDECHELQIKFDKLGDYIDSDGFDNLIMSDKSLMLEQYASMCIYLGILYARIRKFKTAPNE